jgi:hypothetical protein
VPEPLTVGMLVAAALAAGAGKGLLGGVSKDAYENLKAFAGRILGTAVNQLEARPGSDNRAGVVAELVEEQSEPVQAELRHLAEVLRSALSGEGRGALIDNRISVVASGTNSIAAGRDANVGARPVPDK